MAFPNSPPTRHSMRMHPLCSWRQLFSLPFPLTGAGMRARRHSVDQPHVEVRLAGLSAGCRLAAPAGKFSPHADALTHGNGISALATHPPLHADVPSLCSWLRWCSLPFLFTSTGMGGPRLESQPPALPSSWLLPCFDLAAWVALASLEAVTEAMWRWFMSAYEGVVRNCSQRTWSVGLAQ